MISEEEKKAIDRINHVKKELNKDKQEMINYGTYKLYEMFSNDLDTVLNLIEKQNKELDELKKKNIELLKCFCNNKHSCDLAIQFKYNNKTNFKEDVIMF